MPSTSPIIVIGAVCELAAKVGSAAVVGSSALLVLLSAAVMLEVVLQALGNSRMYARWPATALASAVGRLCRE